MTACLLNCKNRDAKGGAAPTCAPATPAKRSSTRLDLKLTPLIVAARPLVMIVPKSGNRTC